MARASAAAFTLVEQPGCDHCGDPSCVFETCPLQFVPGVRARAFRAAWREAQRLIARQLCRYLEAQRRAKKDVYRGLTRRLREGQPLEVRMQSLLELEARTHRMIADLAGLSSSALAPPEDDEPGPPLRSPPASA